MEDYLCLLSQPFFCNTNGNGSRNTYLEALEQDLQTNA